MMAGLGMKVETAENFRENICSFRIFCWMEKFIISLLGFDRSENKISFTTVFEK